VFAAAQPGWEELDGFAYAKMTARQGVATSLQEAVEVCDPLTLQPVPRDGETLGEIMFCGNAVAKGYLKNPEASVESFSGGWFHTGDLAVVDPDGYIRILDRSKDIIISGGENISSLEVEDVLHRHPAVFTAAAVAMADDFWGEVVCVFIETKPGCTVSAEELKAFCALHLARFKLPKKYVFGEIARTSTGKVQKYKLREMVAGLGK